MLVFYTLARSLKRVVVARRHISAAGFADLHMNGLYLTGCGCWCFPTLSTTFSPSITDTLHFQFNWQQKVPFAHRVNVALSPLLVVYILWSAFIVVKCMRSSIYYISSLAPFRSMPYNITSAFLPFQWDGYWSCPTPGTREPPLPCWLPYTCVWPQTRTQSSGR